MGHRQGVDDDTPLRLDVAARLAFPDGSISGAALRRAARAGRLVIERIAGKDFVTLAAIRTMREQSRVVRPNRSGEPVRDFAASTAAAREALDRLTCAHPRSAALSRAQPRSAARPLAKR